LVRGFEHGLLLPPLRSERALLLFAQKARKDGYWSECGSERG